MSMFRSIASAVTTTFNRVEDTANTVGAGIDLANGYVERRKVKFEVLDKQRVAMDLAKDLEEIAEELDQDEDLKNRYEECLALFN